MIFPEHPCNSCIVNMSCSQPNCKEVKQFEDKMKNIQELLTHDYILGTMSILTNTILYTAIILLAINFWFGFWFILTSLVTASIVCGLLYGKEEGWKLDCLIFLTIYGIAISIFIAGFLEKIIEKHKKSKLVA